MMGDDMRTHDQDEALALIAVAMNRSLGVDLSDGQVGVAYAMCDQLMGRRRLRAWWTIPALNAQLDSRRERSLAAALPAFWAAAIHDLKVYVLVVDEASAREDLDLYRSIDEHLSRKVRVELDLRRSEGGVDSRAGEAGILIGAADHAPPDGRHSLIVRLSPGATKRACLIRGVAGLPDL